MTFTDEDINQIALVMAKVASDEGLVREIAEGTITEEVIVPLWEKLCVASEPEIDRMRRKVAGLLLASDDPAAWQAARQINAELVQREQA